MGRRKADPFQPARDIALHVNRRREHARLTGERFDVLEAIQGPLGVDKLDSKGRVVRQAPRSNVDR